VKSALKSRSVASASAVAGRLISRVPAQQATAVVTARVAPHFRVPGTADPAVRLRRLAAVAAWAAFLGFGGMLLVLRMVFGFFTTLPTWWYAPAMCVFGLVGLACTVGAFGSVHRRRLPWALLGVASAAELISFTVTAVL